MFLKCVSHTFQHYFNSYHVMRKSGPYFGASPKVRRLLRKEAVKYGVRDRGGLLSSSVQILRKHCLLRRNNSHFRKQPK